MCFKDVLTLWEKNMALQGRTYVCDVCNQEVLVTKEGGGILVCCGVDMRLKDVETNQAKN